MILSQGSSSQIKPITQPLLLLAGWEGSLGTLEFLIDDLFVYSGHFVIQKGRGNIVFLF
jgi:hypothetical protein